MLPHEIDIAFVICAPQISRHQGVKVSIPGKVSFRQTAACWVITVATRSTELAVNVTPLHSSEPWWFSRPKAKSSSGMESLWYA